MTMDEIHEEGYLTALQTHLPGLLLSVNKTERGDRLKFRYNSILFDDESISFGKANSFDEVEFKASDIASITHEDNTIRVALANGEQFVACMSEQYKEPKENTAIELEDFLPKLRKALAINVIYSEQDVTFRGSYTNIKIENSDNDLDWGGDWQVKLTLGNQENFTEIILNEESIIHIVEEDEDKAIVFFGLAEMPFSGITLTLIFKAITMRVPLCLLNDEDEQ